jgi:ribosomal protein L11 methyltransferase PrmA
MGLLLWMAPLVSEAADPGKVVRVEGPLGADRHGDDHPGYGYEGTPHSVIPAMLELAAITRDDVVHEPGCGDARLVIAAVLAGAKKGVGVDIDPDLAEVSYDRVKAAGLADRIEIYWGNALDVDMSEATVVFLFMGDGFNREIRPKLWRQLPVGARVVSNDYAMGDWKPDRTVKVDTPGRTYVLYRWTITAELATERGATR